MSARRRENCWSEACGRSLWKGTSGGWPELGLPLNRRALSTMSVSCSIVPRIEGCLTGGRVTIPCTVGAKRTWMGGNILMLL